MKRIIRYPLLWLIMFWRASRAFIMFCLFIAFFTATVLWIPITFFTVFDILTDHSDRVPSWAWYYALFHGGLLVGLSITKLISDELDRTPVYEIEEILSPPKEPDRSTESDGKVSMIDD